MEEKRQSGKKVFLLVFLLLLAAAMAALPFVLDRMNDRAGDGSSLLSATVTRADVSRTVAGAGLVGDKEAVTLSIPESVVITGYAVSNGDLVKAGDPVAFVDTVSVYTAIAALGEELEKVTEELAEVQNTWASSYISSTVAGTVTAVYAKDGDDIRSVMSRCGALAEIELDNGTLIKVTAVSGKILTAFIAEGDEVGFNAPLFSVSDVETMGAYGALVLKHQRLEELLAQLFQLYRDGCAVAPADGMITGTDETLVKKLAAGEADGGIRFLSYKRAGEDGGSPYALLAYTGLPGESTRVETEYVKEQIVESPGSDHRGLVSNVYGEVDFSEFPGAKAGDKVFMRMDTTIMTGPDGVDRIANIKWTVLLTESGSDENGGSGNSGGNSRGGSGGNTGSGGTGGNANSGARGGSATGGTSAAASGDEEIGTGKTAIAAVVPMDEALVSISVDELDILTLRVGDAAQVTIDALPGRLFDGVVTGVNTGLSNSGGNSKYSAEVTIARTPDMLDGMNASCTVTIETLRDVLTIPSAALCDENGAQIVYTALGRDRNSLSDPVPVEVGLSDGETLEILDGLAEGDTVWYRFFDTPEYSVSKPRGGAFTDGPGNRSPMT